MNALDYFWFAFKSGWNLAFLFTGLLVGIIGFRVAAIPLLFGFLGADILLTFLLSLVPRYRRIVRANLAHEEEMLRKRRKQSAIRQAGGSYAKEMGEVTNIIREIRKNYRMHADEKNMKEYIERSLAELEKLEKNYVDILYSQIKLKEMKNLNPGAIDREIQQLKAQQETADSKLKEVLGQQIDILEKRKQQAGSGHKEAQLLDAQRKTILETFQLIKESSLNPRVSDTQTEKIQTVLNSFDQMHETIQEIDAISATPLQRISQR